MPANHNPAHHFAVHDVVIVNPGVRDSDTDIDIEGWQGEIVEVAADGDEQIVTIAWDATTRLHMEPWIIDFYEQEGIECEEITLNSSEVSLVTPGVVSLDEASICPNLRKMTREAVEQLADSAAVFQRGVQYLHSDAIHQFTVTSRGISAKVYGHHADYTVEVVDSPDKLQLTCSCPYDGIVCKHLVAVLLRFVETDNRDIVNVALPDVVRQTLAGMSQQELLNLIFELANEREEFCRALMARLTISPQLIAQQPRASAQVRALKQQVAAFFDDVERRAEYGDYGDEYDYRDYNQHETYPELTTTFEIARTLNHFDQMEIFWYVVTCANEIEAEMPLGTPQVAEALIAYTQAARIIIQSPEERLATQKTLLDVLDWNFIDADDVLTAIHQSVDMLCETPDDIRQLITLLQTIDEERFADWIAANYQQLGDDDAYLATRLAHLVTEAQHLELADYWMQHGKPDDAYEVLEQYVLRLIAQMDERTQPYFALTYVQPGGVLDRLKTLYSETGDEKNLCRILLVQSRARGLTVEKYQQIKTLSQSLGSWEELQPLLLSYARNNRETLIRINLLEENWDAALQLVPEKSEYGFGSSDSLLHLIAHGVKAHRPEEALAILLPLVQSNIKQFNRTAYATAASYAADIKDIYYSILHDHASWQTYITGIRQSYPRHRALQEEFRGL